MELLLLQQQMEQRKTGWLQSPMSLAERAADVLPLLLLQTADQEQQHPAGRAAELVGNFDTLQQQHEEQSLQHQGGQNHNRDASELQHDVKLDELPLKGIDDFEEAIERQQQMLHEEQNQQTHGLQQCCCCLRLVKTERASCQLDAASASVGAAEKDKFSEGSCMNQGSNNMGPSQKTFQIDSEDSCAAAKRAPDHSTQSKTGDRATATPSVGCSSASDGAYSLKEQKQEDSQEQQCGESQEPPQQASQEKQQQQHVLPKKAPACGRTVLQRAKPQDRWRLMPTKRCPLCSRRFCLKSIERHIEVCRQRQKEVGLRPPAPVPGSLVILPAAPLLQQQQQHSQQASKPSVGRYAGRGHGVGASALAHSRSISSEGSKLAAAQSTVFDCALPPQRQHRQALPNQRRDISGTTGAISARGYLRDQSVGCVKSDSNAETSSSSWETEVVEGLAEELRQLGIGDERLAAVASRFASRLRQQHRQELKLQAELESFKEPSLTELLPDVFAAAAAAARRIVAAKLSREHRGQHQQQQKPAEKYQQAPEIGCGITVCEAENRGRYRRCDRDTSSATAAAPPGESRDSSSNKAGVDRETYASAASPGSDHNRCCNLKILGHSDSPLAPPLKLPDSAARCHSSNNRTTAKLTPRSPRVEIASPGGATTAEAVTKRLSAKRPSCIKGRCGRCGGIARDSAVQQQQQEVHTVKVPLKITTEASKAYPAAVSHSNGTTAGQLAAQGATFSSHQYELHRHEQPQQQVPQQQIEEPPLHTQQQSKTSESLACLDKDSLGQMQHLRNVQGPPQQDLRQLYAQRPLFQELQLHHLTAQQLMQERSERLVSAEQTARQLEAIREKQIQQHHSIKQEHLMQSSTTTPAANAYQEVCLENLPVIGTQNQPPLAHSIPQQQFQTILQPAPPNMVQRESQVRQQQYTLQQHPPQHQQHVTVQPRQPLSPLRPIPQQRVQQSYQLQQQPYTTLQPLQRHQPRAMHSRSLVLDERQPVQKTNSLSTDCYGYSTPAAAPARHPCEQWRQQLVQQKQELQQQPAIACQYPLAPSSIPTLEQKQQLALLQTGRSHMHTGNVSLYQPQLRTLTAATIGRHFAVN
ncbi:hypothetical protein cyc_02649 [Cyclospora cayetanensis]|uniref:C2HC/C3H-type domain-containing protein n=1 Tax=Cyclospora cayetanensis TaxID=88456 RepID=A0A1D3CVM6_9EIME|nr:hypothetical protein cyc_02649 [Cyclospora cayetanensis]